MLESMKRKQELESTIKEYLEQAEIYPMSDSWELAQTGEYVFVFGMNSFTDGEDEDHVNFLAPVEAEIALMNRIYCLFNAQVSPRTVRSSLNTTIVEIGEFPLSTDEKVQQFNDKVFKILNFHFERQYDAIVPLYQLECKVEFPLANAVLHPGNRGSELARIAEDDRKHWSDDNREQIKNCSYLKFSTKGDNDSRLAQVEYEVERALQVLRFIYPWFEKDGRQFNPSHGVSMWNHSNRLIQYVPTSSSNDQYFRHAEIPNGIFGTRKLSTEFLRYSKEVGGLNDINFHIQNSDCRPVSQRICRALSFFDTAAQTSNGQVAFSNFIVSIDILLPAKNVAAPKLTGFLGLMIEHGRVYTGEMSLDTELEDPESTTWQERVRLTIADFEDFYKTRGQILHGNEEDRYKIRISKFQVKKARQIAHNAIRAYAYLARSFNWQTDKEANNWFKQPCKPPEVKTL